MLKLIEVLVEMAHSDVALAVIFFFFFRKCQLIHHFFYTVGCKVLVGDGSQMK